MRLQRATITNFRGIGIGTTVDFGDMNVVVGRNDVGKSTILKALALFLDNAKATPQMANVASGFSTITIDLAFDAGRTPIIIDQAIETTFEDEELVDADGRVVIRRVWDAASSTGASSTFMLRKKYAEDDFALLNEADLLKLCKKLSIDTAKGNGEEFNNVEKREKLRAYHSAAGTAFDFEYEKFPTSGITRLKLIADLVKNSLPRFEYFQADASLSESDASIQRYLKRIAEGAIAAYDTSGLETAVRSSLDDKLGSITKKINAVAADDEQVTSKTDFDWGKSVSTAFDTGDKAAAIPLALRGDGFRRIAMMAYFEHLAEEDNADTRGMIFAFEEPETFLHPSAQESLFDKLVGLQDNGYQVVVSTHSPVIVARTRGSEIIHVSKTGTDYVVEQAPTDLQAIADDIGITVDNQFIQLFETAKVLLLVEGKDDVAAMHHVARQYKSEGIITHDFDDLGVCLVPMGGSGSVKGWVSHRVLQNLGKPHYFFLDSDRLASPTDTSEHHAILTGLGYVENDDFWLTRKREIENYIPADHLNSTVQGADLSYTDWDDVKKACGASPKSSELKGKNVVKHFFETLDYSALSSSFTAHGDDEFLAMYQLICAKLPTAP